MATRVELILAKARDTLADPNAERWSNNRLIRLVDEAQRDIAKQSRILKSSYDLALSIGISTYTLPDDVWLITRASYLGCVIDLISYDSMDELAVKQALSFNSYNSTDKSRVGSDFGDSFNVCWEDTIGNEVTALIYDNRNLQQIRVYPIPNDSLVEAEYTFVNDDGPSQYVGDQVFGVVVGIDDYTLSTVYGCVATLYDPAIATEYLRDAFGVVTDINEAAGIVRIWYVKTPATVEDIDTVLEIPPMFDVAIKHYVVGHAFLDDLDTRYQARAAEALAFYERELLVVKDTEAKSGTRSPVAFKTTYRGAFE